MYHKLDTGQQLAKIGAKPCFVRMGLRIAFFRFSLTVPSSIDFFKIWVMMGAKTAAYSFTSDDDIGSNSQLVTS